MANKRTNWTTLSFKNRIYELYNDIEVISEYVNSSQPITVKCTICNNVWNPTANNLLRGISHCPICSKKKRGISSRISQEDFVKLLCEKNPNIQILGAYKTNKERIACRCAQCGNEWNPIAGSLLQGHGCQKCARKVVGNKRKTTHASFVQKLSKIRPSIEVLGEYASAYIPIECKCNVCGNVWMAIPHNILTRSGCPECSHSATSFIEQFILLSFQKALGEEKILTRDKKIIGKELDIFIPSMKVAIEPGGWSFHKRRIKKDIEKRKLCNQKGIRLITVYYGCDEILNEIEDVLVYKTNFSTENDFNALTELVYLLFDMTNIKCIFQEKDWIELKAIAYQNSRKTTTKEFALKLNSINPNITILGEYKSSSERIKCKCNICEHIWNPQANCLIQGRGCPNCKKSANASRLRFSNNQFLAKLKSNNANIVPLEKYIDSKTKIKFRCSKCNYEWKTKPEILFQGSGCPNCAGRPSIDTNSFKARLKAISPNFEIIGEYINTETKIEYRCKSCGFVGNARPNYLLKGRKCLNCLGRRNIDTKVFIERMSKINPNIEIMGEYVNTSTKILCLCITCGNEWLGAPRDLQTGHGCPECGRKRKGKRKITLS